MRTEYLRVPLTVDALFLPDGSFRPRKIYFGGEPYEITRVLQKRRYCPRVVRCITPVEYTVIIDKREKKIYYEADTNTWFSVKEVYLD